MIESGYYPPGAEYDKSAPYNEVETPEKEVEVTVSITLSKTVKIKVSDYITSGVEVDEDGNKYEDIDYSECDLKKAVEEQIILPNKAYNYMVNKKAYENMKDWNIDDFEVVLG